MAPEEKNALIVRIERLKEELKFLKENKPQTYDEFIKNPVKRRSLERSLEVALEAVLDIGRLIISLKNLPKPSDNTEIFDILALNNILPKDFAKNIRGIGGMRNVLVHDYIIIDYRKVYEALEKLDHFKKFVEYIVKAIEK